MARCFKNMFGFSVFSVVLLTMGMVMSGLSASAEAGGFETSWLGGDRTQMRLISAEAEWQGKLESFVAIEIRLAPKWKTYWRTPGDTGIPPSFDWSSSKNLLKAEVLYPVPSRFVDPTGMSIGYKSGVTLPVKLTPIDPSKPVELVLDANYAICHDLCIPVAVKQALVVERQSLSPFVPVLSMAISELPLPTKSPHKKLGVSKVRLVSGVKKSLTIKLNVPVKAEKIDLFVEGPDGLYVPTPKPVVKKGAANVSGARLFKIDLSDVDDPKKFVGAHLTCTLQADDLAVVQPCIVE